MHIYICVQDIVKSVNFYKNIFQKEPDVYTENRWVSFSCGHTLAFFSIHYDEELLKNDKHCNEKFNKEYQDDCCVTEKIMMNNQVIFNLYCDNLKSEHERLKALQGGTVSTMYYVNIKTPYWYFNISGPNGNLLEITRPMHKKADSRSS